MRHLPAGSLTVVTLTAAVVGGHAQDGPYRFSKEIQIGGEGGWDYLSVDPAAHRLYVSHGTKVAVIDTKPARSWAKSPTRPASTVRRRGRSRTRLLEQRAREQGRASSTSRRSN